MGHRAVLICGFALAAGLAPSAAAQPGRTPAHPAVPSPYAYRPLSADEERILDEGEIPSGARTGGAVLAFVVGFGVGQAAQGRWSEKGWLFTVGEGLSAGVLIALALRDCDNPEGSCSGDAGLSGEALAAISWTVFRIWGFVDAISGPSRHNRRVRELRARAQASYGYAVTPYVNRSPSGGVAGLTVAF